MNAEIISIIENITANEVETNVKSAVLGLMQLGINTKTKTSVINEKDEILKALNTASKRCEIIVLISSLDSGIRDIITKTDNFSKEATEIPASFGGNNGLISMQQNRFLIALPDNRLEICNMINIFVSDYFSTVSDRPFFAKTISLYDVSKAEAELKLSNYIKCHNPSVSIYDSNDELYICITATGSDKIDAKNIGTKVENEITDMFKHKIYSATNESLSEATVKTLIKHNMSVSVAESCTGGMVIEKLTGVPGASNVIEIGICAYSNRIKRDALGVPERSINLYGAVSSETAGYMALGVKNISGSTFGVSITGVAGPDKSEGKDIGTVYICLNDGKKAWIVELNLSNKLSRDEIRNISSNTALELMRRYAEFDGKLENSCDAKSNFKAYHILPTTFEAIPKSTAEQPMFIVSNIEDDMLSEQISDAISSSSDEITENYDILEFPESNDIYNIVDIGEDNTEENKLEKKEKSFNKLLCFLFPNKNHNAKENIIKSISLFFALLIIFGSGFMGNYFYVTAHQNKILKNAQTVFSTQSNAESYNSLYALNDNYKCWLQLGNINSPIYQYTDNEFYLTHNMEKKKSRYGALYFDYRDVVAEDGTSINCTVYGKNANDGSMFGSLDNYKNANYFIDNRKVSLTFANKQTNYEIFSVFIANSVKEDDNGNLYNFVRDSFTTTEEFSEWINEAQKRSLYITGCSVTTTDRILTLVTTSDEFSNARLVIMAKMLNNNESLSDSSKIKVNPSPLYPQAWYDAHGIDGYTEVVTTSTISENTTSSQEVVSSEASSSSTSSKPKTTSSRQTRTSSTSQVVTSVPESSESTPTESTPTESTPSESTPSEQTPSEHTPSENTPSEATPSEQTPSEEQ